MDTAKRYFRIDRRAVQKIEYYPLSISQIFLKFETESSEAINQFVSYYCQSSVGAVFTLDQYPQHTKRKLVAC